jgi:hypothetical protein
MKELDDVVFALSEVQSKIEDIEVTLQSHLGGNDVNGIGYAANQIWHRLNLHGDRVYGALAMISIFACLTFVAVVAHVVHHW